MGKNDSKKGAETTNAANTDTTNANTATGADATTPAPKAKRKQQSQAGKMKTADGILSAIASGAYNLKEAKGSYLILENTKKNNALSVKPKPEGFDEAIKGKIEVMKASLAQLQALIGEEAAQ